MVIGIGIVFFPPVSIFIVVLLALSASQMRSKGGTGTLPSAARVNLTLHPKQEVIQLLSLLTQKQISRRGWLSPTQGSCCLLHSLMVGWEVAHPLVYCSCVHYYSPARSDLFYWWLNAIATPAMDHWMVN